MTRNTYSYRVALPDGLSVHVLHGSLFSGSMNRRLCRWPPGAFVSTSQLLPTHNGTVTS